MKTSYTEVWISSAVSPLVQFADRVCSLSSTRLDMVFDEVPTKLAAELAGFDEVVSWYGTNRPDFRKAMSAIQPNCHFLAALPVASSSEHAADFFLRQVGAPPGGLPHIGLPSGSLHRSVVIHPYSGSTAKNWPIYKYRQLAARLPSSEWAHDRYENLLDLAIWMKGAARYVGNDSGITHLAAAIGLPVLALFGPTDPAIWSPRGDRVKVLRHQPLQELSVEMVLEELLRL